MINIMKIGWDELKCVPSNYAEKHTRDCGGCTTSQCQGSVKRDKHHSGKYKQKAINRKV